MRLSQQGLIRSVRRRGYVVAPITMRDVNGIFQLRLLLEPQAARLAASNSVDEKQLRRLDQLCGAGYLPGDSGSAAAFLRANREFHVSIARSSGNERLANMIDQLLDEMERLFHFGLSLRNRTLEMRHEHEELVDALAQGNSDAAERIAAEQILTAKKMVTDAIMSNSEMMDVNLAAISDGRLRA
jgi:DNA-binding GntR family transcriptional regulator